MKTNINTTFKKQMQEIMNMAWMFCRQYGYTMSEALKTAWRNYKLRCAMTQRVVKFLFEKVDGSLRTAYGTLKSDIVPPTGDGRKPNPTIQVYYDCEKQAWRCFKRAQLMEIA